MFAFKQLIMLLTLYVATLSWVFFLDRLFLALMTLASPVLMIEAFCVELAIKAVEQFLQQTTIVKIVSKTPNGTVIRHRVCQT